MWTRQQYMNKECTHQEYYLPIAQECGISLVKSDIAWYCLRDTDENFNQLTSLGQWDRIAVLSERCFRKALEKRGDFYSLAGGLCILKAMARHEKGLGLYDHWKDKPDPLSPKTARINK